MAQRRMISKKITDTDAFLDMSISAQALYFHMNMHADDDGFVSSPKKIMRMIGANDDDYKILILKRFVISFDSGVCVIKHWLIHNLIRGDRYNETTYLDEKKTLNIKENKVYTENVIPNGNQMAPQVRIGKARIGKASKEAIDLPEWLNKKSWKEWVDYRKEIKKALKPSTEKKQISFLEKNQKDHVAIIDASIQNGWTGLFEIKGNFKKAQNTILPVDNKYEKYGS